MKSILEKNVLNDQQLALLEFVKQKHGNQKRKYTGEPYFNHLIEVALIICQYIPALIETALCHDLLEDTDCTFDELYNKMIEIGFNPNFSHDTCSFVVELTDVFTKEAYPELNRQKRKELEAERLGKISSLSQTVKYADLIDNTKSIFEHDKSFAKTYIKEKMRILELMTNGNKHLFKICKEQIENIKITQSTH